MMIFFYLCATRVGGPRQEDFLRVKRGVGDGAGGAQGDGEVEVRAGSSRVQAERAVHARGDAQGQVLLCSKDVVDLGGRPALEQSGCCVVEFEVLRETGGNW